MTASAARDYYELAIESDGAVWAWGSGQNGELGDNKATDGNIPVQVIFLLRSMFLPAVLK